ncbi:MAG: Asp23/Gls24 family envelope stress response protein, partial [Ruminococcaceae bacterium]|nr:Asp23/Gls24 family envelope stress response protein [Oscillospiraceae bacterium]
AAVATLEVEGVAALAPKTTDIKEVFVKSEEVRAVKVNKSNDVTTLDIYISVNNGCDVRAVAEKVQTNVKSKLQNMTGSAINKVNVIIADVVFAEEGQ